MTAVLRLSLPMTLWLVSFSAVYGMHGIVCASSWGTSDGPGGYPIGQLVLMAAGALAVAAQASLLVALWKGGLGGPAGFMQSVTRGLAVVGVVASVWTLIPVVALAPCNPSDYSGAVQSLLPQA